MIVIEMAEDLVLRIGNSTRVEESGNDDIVELVD